MASGSAVEFVPARHPEAIHTDLSRYKVITASEPLTDTASALDGESAESSNEKLKEKEIASKFFDINEKQTDFGTREPKRVHKSWPADYGTLAGLENQGVTCYQNAALQSILHQPAVGVYLEEVSEGKHPHISDKSVTRELAQLFMKMRAKKSSVFPLKMINRLEDINPMLSEWQQEDSHEYFMSLISRLQEDSVPKGKKLRSSIMHDIFGGSVEQNVECMRCHSVSTTSQDFYDLPVCFSTRESENNKYTLQQSVQDFFHPEKIDLEVSKGGRKREYNGYQCEKCQRETNAVKSISIDEAPEYLTVHIKRFKMDGSISKKLKNKMEYPMLLDLTQYESEKLAGSGEKLVYKLSAVILHEGRTVSSGHYVAYARDVNNKWLLYDDDYKQSADEADVVSNPAAYILVYSRLAERPVDKQTSNKKDKSKKRKKEGAGGKKKRKESADAVNDIERIFGLK